VALRHGHVDEAKRLYQTITGSYPDDVEAWIQLGELLFHSGPPRGYPATESREAWRRVLSFEPSNVAALIHLGRLAAAEDTGGELDSIVRQIVALRANEGLTPAGTREEDLEMVALRAFTHGDSMAQREVLAGLARASDLTVALTGIFVASFAGNLDGAASIFKLLKAPDRSPNVRSVGFRYQAHLDLARGHYQAALQTLDSLSLFDPRAALEFRSVFAAAPFLPVHPQNLPVLRRRLTQAAPLPPSSAENVSIQFNVHDRLHDLLTSYIMGITAARQSDHATALREADALDARTPGPPDSPNLPHDLSRGIRAEMAWQDHDAPRALAELERMFNDVSYQVTIASPMIGLTRERFLLAEALNQAGRKDEAIRWYTSFNQFSAYDLMYLAPSQLARARIYEDMGDRPRAVQLYRRFIEAWKTADPDLQPLVREAATKVAALQ
jgi:tetratricopeptide (TPR) repeat protein